MLGLDSPRVKYKVAINDVYNRLTVIGDCFHKEGSNGKKKRVVLCRCSCGTELLVEVASLCNGNTKSCGCFKRDTCKSLVSITRKYNTYETDGEVTKVFDDKGNFTLIDTSDIEKIKSYYCFRDNRYGYWSFCKDRVLISMHRFLVDCPDGLVVDHINHDRSDNRRCNLKICTRGDNRKNQPFIGIVFLEHIGKWQASIKNDGTIKYIGVFDTFEEALMEFKSCGGEQTC